MIKDEWERFEKALNNPFEFDELVNGIRKRNRENEKREGRKTKRKLKKSKEKGKSVD